jgi:hypothetical protein
MMKGWDNEKDPFWDQSMLFKQSMQTIVLGFALWVCLLFGAGQTPIMAATLNAAAGSVSQEQTQVVLFRKGWIK